MNNDNTSNLNPAAVSAPYPPQQGYGFAPPPSYAGEPGFYPPPPDYANAMHQPQPMASAGMAYPPPPPYNDQKPGPMWNTPQMPQGGHPSAVPYPVQGPPVIQGGGPGMQQPAGHPSAVPYLVQGPPVIQGGGPGMQQPVLVTSMTNVAFVTSSLTTVPGRTMCTSCQQVVLTRIEPSTGLLPWIICGVLFVVGCWLGCCLIPFCIDSLKDTNHFCPNCNHLIHRHKQM